MPDAESIFDDQTSRRLEVLYRTPDVVNQRRATLRLLAPQPGERILDVGSGPGLLVAEMAELVGPSGHVTGIDIASPMIALSKERFGHSPLAERMTFLKADATALPFDEASFHAAVSVQVYEYIDDVDAALAQLRRVLVPGGRALIVDTDWDSIVWNAADKALMGKVISAWTGRFAHPHLPRTVSRRLRDAGFQIQHRGVLTMLNPEYDPNTYSVAHLPIIGDYVASHGRIGRHEVDDWKKDLHRMGKEDTYFFSLSRFLFLAVASNA